MENAKADNLLSKFTTQGISNLNKSSYFKILEIPYIEEVIVMQVS